MHAIGRIGIIAFCLWHMYAVMIYVIPDENGIPWIRQVVDLSMPVVRPYMFATSQWQKWNIFAPDPLRRVSYYSFQLEKNGVWQPLREVDPQKLPFWKRSKELKLMRRLEDENDTTVRQYLSYVCRDGQAPRGAHIRVLAHSYVIPEKSELARQGGWRNYEKQFYDQILSDFYCPRT